MKTSILRTISSRLLSSLSPSPVAPWPQPRTSFDQWLTSELCALRLQPHPYAAAAWLSRALDVAISAQKSAARSIKLYDPTCAKPMRDKGLDHHLQVAVDLLDACAAARRRIGTTRTYVNSLTIALHCLEGVHEPSLAAVRRASAELDSCAAAERCMEFGRCGSSLRKLGERLAAHGRKLVDSGAPDVHEAICGSQAATLLVLSMVEIASSFRTRQGVMMIATTNSKSSTTNISWGNSLKEIQKGAKEEFNKRRGDHGTMPVLEELAATVAAARRLRGLVSARDQVINVREVKVVVGELGRRCVDLEEGLRPLEERVDVLYRELIGVRMSLLGMISNA